MPATTWLSGSEAAAHIRSAFPEAVLREASEWVEVDPAALADVARFLRDDPKLDCDYLVSVTGVDRLTHFEIVYHISSLSLNHMLVLKVLAVDRENAVVPSVVGVWHGAHLQEREVFDLMGVSFSGHPNLKRLFLWDGFKGHPLRKDFLTVPGGVKPGLQRFVREFPDGQEGYPHVPQD